MTSAAIVPRRSPETGPVKASHLPFRQDIQGLRAIAVGLVLLSHARVPGFSGGFVGVDVFFVISGFLITGLLLADVQARGRVLFGKFYARRALRILPAATVVLVGSGLAALQVLNPVRAKEVLGDSLWASLFAANIHFSREGTDYFSDDALSPLQHFWSLAVEEQYYLVWPALLALTLASASGVRNWRLRTGRFATDRPDTPPFPRRRIVLVLAVLTGLSLLQSVHQTASAPTSAYFSTLARAWELGAGALLATVGLHLQRLTPGVRALLSWGGVAGISVSALAYDSATRFPGTAALLPVLATCALLAAGAGPAPQAAARLLSAAPMRFVGNISYSLYLWHWPLLILAAARAGHALPVWQNVLLLGVAVGLATGSYYLVENPMRRPKRVFGPKLHQGLLLWPVALACVVLMVVVGEPSTPAAAGPRVVAIDAGRSAPTHALAAVSAEAARTPVPTDLAPPLTELKKDFTNIGDCSGYKRTSSKLCELGDPAGAKRVVLFGNSHAVMWVPAVQADAKAAHWRFVPVVKEACGYADYVLAPASNQCAQWYAWALKQLTALAPDLIVINAYDSGTQWEPALTRALADMKSRAPRVLLLSDPPGLTFKPIDCLLRSGATLGDCTSPLRAGKVHAEAVDKQLAADAGLEFLSTQSWFCAQERCPSVINGMVTYSDVGHVTATYSRFLAPDLAPALDLR